MSTEVTSTDWTALDSWWSAYAQTCPVAQLATATRTFATARAGEEWASLDPWWQTGVESGPIASSTASSQAPVAERSTDSWMTLDPWWRVYTETGSETAAELAALLEQSNEQWAQSAAPFDLDPLASTVTEDRIPFLPGNEEGWSDWLAAVLQSSPALVAECFEVAVNHPPDDVVREDQLSKEEGGFRRPDILVLYPDRGISVEVKLDDLHYRKTAETAALIEREYPDKDWTHTLLLPERNLGRLRARVDPPIQSRAENGLQVEWASPGPVSVLRWRDVTTAIRTVLCQGDVVDSQWAANTYLFCGAVEQQILRFQPQSAVKRLATPTTAVDVAHQVKYTHTLEEQLNHLHANPQS